MKQFIITKCIAKPFLFFILISLAFFSRAQDPCNNRNTPLDEYAFHRLMYSQFSYAITGNEAPVTGFKLETAKPTISIAGNIYQKESKNLIINLQLKGGLLDNNTAQIFSGKKLNSSFQGVVGFNVFFKYHPALYSYNVKKRGGEDKETYRVRVRTISDLIKREACDNRESISSKLDTLAILKSLIEESELPTQLADFNSIVETTYTALKFQGYVRSVSSTIRESLTISLLNHYGGMGCTPQDIYDDFRVKRSSGVNLNLSDLMSKYNQLKNFDEDKKNIQADYEINAFKDIWVRKQIWWLNISPQISNSSLTLLDTSINTLADKSSLSYGLNTSINVYNKYKNARFLYWRFGIGLNKANNLVDLGTMEYKKVTILENPSNEVLTKEKTGTAYRGNLVEGWSPTIFTEFYYTPVKKISLGVYANSKFSYLKNAINSTRLSLDLGIIWNVVNNEKDSKNVLSVIPYVGWSNLLKNYVDFDKTQLKSKSDLFSVGIKFGVPINVGK